MDLGLRERTAIVTGGASNIGRGIVLALASEGANVVIADMDEKQGKKTADDANALAGGGRTVLIKTDATNFESIQSMVKKTLGQFGQIDVLCNNVGWATLPQPFGEAPMENWESEMRGMYWTGILCSKAIVPHMKARKRGVIIFTTSTAGKIGLNMMPVYSGAKGAQMASMKALAKELGPFGIRVLGVGPGLTVATEEDAGDLSSWRQWAWKGFVGTVDKKEQHLQNMPPLGRMCTPGDVGAMAAFLASDRASYCTGHVYPVDGGAAMVY